MGYKLKPNLNGNWSERNKETSGGGRNQLEEAEVLAKITTAREKF